MKNGPSLTFVLSCLLSCVACAKQPSPSDVLSIQKIEGEVWVSPNIKALAKATRRVTVKVWFEEQFLGAGDSYKKRAQEFGKLGRRELRKKVVATLKETSRRSFAKIDKELESLKDNGVISSVTRHWIVNGFSCVTTVEKLDALKRLAGVKKIFVMPMRLNRRPTGLGKATDIAEVESQPFDPNQFKHPWYIRSLLADKVWKEFGIAGKGTLNVIHDFNFAFPANLRSNVYRNQNEIPANGKDDDGNGLIDDVHGFNFAGNSAQLTVVPGSSPQSLHGTTCANIICGSGSTKTPFEFGIAPEGKWAGVIAGNHLESAVEWAILQNADTYSMSFSIPNLGEMRSHWRKVMEHGSFCGVYFVSGAGNFAQTVKVPVQMRVPEDIPEVVFAAAGVQRNLTRTPFSSKGPVEWNTEHYRDGRVQKPEVCAFNMGLPMMLADGTIRPSAANGNSFAGPMFCGAISLMLSADPDLLPWDLREIITSTALDVGPEGVDFETGHGLINCYRAVKEVLRRKAVREGKDSSRFAGRSEGDELDVDSLKKALKDVSIRIVRLGPNGNAAKVGLKVGDLVKKADGKQLVSATQLVQLINQPKQDTISIEISRDGKKLAFELPRSNPGMRLSQSFSEPVFK